MTFSANIFESIYDLNKDFYEHQEVLHCVQLCSVVVLLLPLSCTGKALPLFRLLMKFMSEENWKSKSILEKVHAKFLSNKIEQSVCVCRGWKIEKSCPMLKLFSTLALNTSKGFNSTLFVLPNGFFAAWRWWRKANLVGR